MTVPGPGWDDILNALLTSRGAAMIIGETDSGKSSLARYLLERLVAEKVRVSLVDSDIGQSALGLPGTISMKIFRGEDDLEGFSFEKMSFVGTASPAKNITSMIKVTKSMTDLCRKSSEIVLVDTTGLVSGSAGRALKIGKIRAVGPEHVIAVERGDELGHILSLIENTNLHKLRASGMAKTRSSSERFHYRRDKLSDYFSRGCADLLLNKDEVKFSCSLGPAGLKDCGTSEGALVGLNHKGDTLALGVVTEITPGSVSFRAPVKSLKDIDEVVFGDMKY